MRVNIPELQDANRDGFRVYHYVAPAVVDAFTMIGVGLIALAIALVYATTEGSGVAAKRGGRRG